MLGLAVAGGAAFMLAAFGQALTIPQYAAISAVVGAAAVSVVLAALIAALVAGTYVEDRDPLRKRLATVWPYMSRGTMWGLAAAGIGALLATALPNRLAAASSNPSALPVAGWVAVIFGAFGLAAGLLETWNERSQHSARSDDEPAP